MEYNIFILLFFGFIRHKNAIAFAFIYLTATMFLHAENPSSDSSVQYLAKNLDFQVKYPVTALAMSADEALIAVAMNKNGDAVIQLHDRHSSKMLAYLVSADNPVHQLMFDPRKWSLAIAGEERIEIWDLENLQSHSKEALSKQWKIWEKQTTTPQISFSKKSKKLRWLEQSKLKEVNLSPPYNENKVWIGEGISPKLQRFSFDSQEITLALIEAGSNQIRLLSPKQKTIMPVLDYHLFPATDLHFGNLETLISLDREKRLIWGDINQRIKIHTPALKKVTLQENAVRFLPVFKDHTLLLVTKNVAENENYVHLISKNGETYHKFSIATTGSVTVSPTGSFVITASPENLVTLYKATLHQSPEEYISQLNAQDAQETARRYRNHLDELPKSLQLETANNTLEILEESLRVAEQTQQWLEMDRLSREILEMEPKNYPALKVRKFLELRKEKLFLEKGRKQLQILEYMRAITQLKQIPATSEYYAEARNLIDLAEKQAQNALRLRSAEKQLKVKNWEGASLLIDQVLAQNPENVNAQLLMEEVDDQKSWSFFSALLWFLVGIFIAFALFIFFYKKRKRLMGWVMDDEETPVTLKSFPDVDLKNEAPSAPDPAEKQFIETLTKVTELLKLAQKRDFFGEYTARLMDFEVEISIISNKAKTSGESFKHLNSQLLVLVQTLRGLKFKTKAQNNSQRQAPPQEIKAEKKENYYELLGISPNATDDQIKKAYHKKIKEYHPDKHQNTDYDWIKEQAEAMTRSLGEAYDVLKNEATRRKYNSTLK